MIRAETAAVSLKTSGEVISDSLLIAMILKGLPSEYKPFTTVITQKEKSLNFTEFKVALRSFEETEKACRPSVEKDDVVMKFESKAYSGRPSKAMNIQEGKYSRPCSSPGLVCFKCGKQGHKAAECYSRPKVKRWCEICKNTSHDTKFCRKRNDKVNAIGFSKSDSSDDPRPNHYFAFKVSVKKHDVDTVHKVNGMLVDCGATTHVVNDVSRFISFDENFDPKNHVIELADGSKVNNIVLDKGTACVSLVDSNGKKRDGVLKNVLYVPSFKQNIFSVQAATETGASVEFNKSSAKLINVDGTEFGIEKHGSLYFLKNVGSPKNASYSLKEWH